MNRLFATALVLASFLAIVGMSNDAMALQAVFACDSDEDCADLECHECEDNICVYQEDCGAAESSDEQCECSDDSDCPCGKCDDCWCEWVEKNECESDEDCENGGECESGECGNVCMDVDEEGGGAPDCDEDSDCGECAYCDGVYCVEKWENECEGLEGCGDGEICVPGECGNVCEKKTGDNPWLQLCVSSGGDWVDCLPGCGMPTCENPEPGMECDMACMPACECPEWMPYWDEEKGCVGQPYCDELACKAEGKFWNECGASSCPGCDDCIGTCECPEGLQENADGDCVAIKPIEDLCDETGGTFNDCGSACAPDPCNPDEPVDCPAICVPVCECPDDKPIWNMVSGCMAGEIPEPICEGPGKICQDSGGTWDECAGSSCPTCDDCIADCICPAGTAFDGEEGCIAVPAPEDICADTGGSWECVSDCDPGDECEAICFDTCVCPDETPTFSLLNGCVESGEEGGESVIVEPAPGVTIEGETKSDGCKASSNGLHMSLLALFLAIGALTMFLGMQRKRVRVKKDDPRKRTS